ncbi:hypothetical protein ACFXJ8_08030 [Nonomuraea sp. NPDC059194]|uniref:hypothetical protein n=1 Tax=Nonomuraea sp. NPDC059194 TaxID=3346764 RepID=UPI0036AFF30E
MTRIIAVLVLLLTGCAEKLTLNENEAISRVERLIRDTVAVIEPRPRLDAFLPSLNRRYCLDPTDGGSEERVIVNRRYYLRGIPKERFVDVANRVKAHWQQQGHLITGVNGLETREPDISGRSRPDDFILSLSWTQGDVLGIGVTSTCVWPDVK